jgi:hypothetical protein
MTVEISEGGLTREDLLNLGRAPTYEEIMSVIAEYPGEDEPLYVPAADEAIWLTDLEGHADIYDNDSIKINYAEWYDRSQITKIEVYRNGIKMRFLPDTLDVVTNGQMKTFDGNPLEHTPVSNHSDHAIYGYEYRVVVFAAAGSVEKTTLIRAPFAVSGNYKYADLLSTWNWAVAADWMTDFAVKEYIEDLAQLGFNGIYFDVALFARDDHRAEFFAQHEYDPAVSPEWMLTALDGDILDVLGWINEAGLNAELGVQLYIIPYGSGANGYRSFVHPDNVVEWFSAYTDRVLHYARLAEQGGAKIFRPVVEFNTMQRETEQMEGLLDAVRRVFSGDLMVAESTNHYIYNMADFYSATFWDYPGLTLGVNCWTPTMEVQKDQRLSYMAQRFVSDWQPVIAQYRNEFPDTPIVFSEIGWFNFDGSALGLAADPSSGPRDDQEMADAWAAYLIAVEFLQLDGVNVWTFGVASPHASHGGSVVNDSSALPIIGSLLGGTPMYYLPVDKLAQPSD